MNYTREYLTENCNLPRLKYILTELGGKPGTLNKQQVIDTIMQIQNGEEVIVSKRGRPSNESKSRRLNQDGKAELHDHEVQMSYGDTVTGILDICQDGYGFIRVKDYFCSPLDAYVAKPTIRSYKLAKGDLVCGKIVRKRERELPEMVEVLKVNGHEPTGEELIKLDELCATHPNKKIELSLGGDDLSLKVIDLLCPIGYGQRGLIVAPAKAGKTTLLKKIAYSIEKNHPEISLMVLLTCERPEEVTDFKQIIKNGEVISSTFDQPSEHQASVAELAFARAKRIAEEGGHAFILMDSLTKITRAYNTFLQSSGRVLSGGIDPVAFSMPKKMFASARNTPKGSLTVLATCLVETGSKMDDVIYEEFKGTGNMEVVLSRELSERRIFPAIDIKKSGTRKEELLLSEKEYQTAIKIRQSLPKGEVSYPAVFDLINKQ